jgi:IS30 family transposase
VALVERKSGYAFQTKVKHKTSDLVSSAIITKLKPLAPLVKTLTFNNWKEFGEHARIDIALQLKMCFSDLLPAVKRGSNEGFNDILLQYSRKIDLYLL